MYLLKLWPIQASLFLFNIIGKKKIWNIFLQDRRELQHYPPNTSPRSDLFKKAVQIQVLSPYNRDPTIKHVYSEQACSSKCKNAMIKLEVSFSESINSKTQQMGNELIHNLQEQKCKRWQVWNLIIYSNN